MCTVVVFWQSHPVAPLVIAQCRDEVLDRAAGDVEKWPNGIVAGRDLVAGGTWFAIGERVTCALTNRRDERGPRRGRASRGELVVEAALASDAGAVERVMRGEDGPSYGPFSLLAVDDARMIYAENSAAGDAMLVRAVEPGVHVLGNFGLDNEGDVVVRTVGAAARALVAVTDEERLALELRALLGKHGEGWPCVHLQFGDVGYGTRSAGVLMRRARGSRLWVHPAAPHDASGWRDGSALVA
jgi:uncharacterized protein with NRDE domain